jgi:pyruvate dehydrogenase E2 component (dihydrolipoamide acetyltransferase)
MDVEVRMPQVSDSTEEGIVVTWFVQPGDRVAQGGLVAEVQVEKVSTDVVAPMDGWLVSALIEQGGVVSQGAVIGVLTDADPNARRGFGSAPAAAAASEEPRSAADAGRVMASPSARRLAKEHGLDLSSLRGSGPRGRIVESDVLAAVTASTGPEQTSDQEASTSEQPRAGADTAEPLSPERRTIARRLQGWLAETAQLTLTAEVDVTELASRLPAWTEAWGERATYTGAVVAACAAALRDHPRVAARRTDDGLVPATDLDIGVAVELDDALIVPVVQRADTLDLHTLTSRIAHLAERARSGRLAADETRGGVFSVTSLGGYRIDAFTPLLNPPQTAILGVGRARSRPAVHDGEVLARTLLVLSLTFDHQVVDGAPAAAFLTAVAERLEQPDTLAASGS